MHGSWELCIIINVARALHPFILHCTVTIAHDRFIHGVVHPQARVTRGICLNGASALAVVELWAREYLGQDMLASSWLHVGWYGTLGDGLCLMWRAIGSIFVHYCMCYMCSLSCGSWHDMCAKYWKGSL